MTPDQIKIIELESKVADLIRNQNLLMTFFRDSTPTKLYLRNIISFDKESQIGFFGANPVKKQASITAPSGGGTVDSQARTAIGSIITTLQTLGLIS